MKISLVVGGTGQDSSHHPEKPNRPRIPGAVTREKYRKFGL